MTPLRILLIGGGGREHALAWKLLDSDRCAALLVAPGNPGIEAMADRRRGRAGACVACRSAPRTARRLVALAERERIDLVVCGPGGAAGGRAGRRLPGQAGIRFFGPTQAAAEIESSKAYAKQLMIAAGVPTARLRQLRRCGAPPRRSSTPSPATWWSRPTACAPARAWW